MSKIKKPKKFVLCKDRNGKKYKTSVDTLSFRPSVYTVIIKDKKILLSKQWDGYDFPGGGIDLGETIEGALKREVWEETGLRVTINDLITCENSFFRSLYLKTNWQSIMMYYLCDITGGKLSVKNLDEQEREYADMPEWIPFSKLKKIKFYNSVDSLAVIKKAQKLCQKK
jgi:8-oxo-dGTP diphosphatase